MAIRIRGSKSRGDLYWNRLCDSLLAYDQEQIQENWSGEYHVGASELQAAILAADNGNSALVLTEAAAKLLAFLAYYWLDYYGDQGHNDDEFSKRAARSRRGLCERILGELKSQGVVYVETRAAVVWS
jgi:hypothetical protein